MAYEVIVEGSEMRWSFPCATTVWRSWGKHRGEKVPIRSPIHARAHASKIEVLKELGDAWVMNRWGRGQLLQTNDHLKSLRKDSFKPIAHTVIDRWIRYIVIFGRSYPATQIGCRIACEQEATSTRPVGSRTSAHSDKSIWKVDLRRGMGCNRTGGTDHYILALRDRRTIPHFGDDAVRGNCSWIRKFMIFCSDCPSRAVAVWVHGGEQVAWRGWRGAWRGTPVDVRSSSQDHSSLGSG
jgi:hypothetical protein